MLAEVKPGIQAGSDGTPMTMRATRDGAGAVADCHARYYEAVYRGNVYAGGNSAAITFGTALTATGVTFHLFNPKASGVNLVILKTAITILTCTTAGSIVYAANINVAAAAPTTTTAITIVNCLLGNAKTGVGQLFSVATLPAAPTQVRPVSSSEGTTPLGSPSTTIDEVAGELIVIPGACLSVQGITIAGTGLIGMSWEEVPV